MRWFKNLDNQLCSFTVISKVKIPLDVAKNTKELMKNRWNLKSYNFNPIKIASNFSKINKLKNNDNVIFKINLINNKITKYDSLIAIKKVSKIPERFTDDYTRRLFEAIENPVTQIFIKNLNQ